MSRKQYNYIYLYYLVLLAFIVVRDSESAPNIIIRFTYLMAFFIPLVVKYNSFLPACLTCFMTVGIYGYSYNLFPYQMALYPIICILGLLFSQTKTQIGTKDFCFAALLLYILIINLFDSGEPQNLFFSALTVLCFALFSRKSTNDSSFYMMNCFSVSTLSLSLIYLVNYDKFLQVYNDAEGVVRSGWTDPNYLSCIIGMGLITSLILLLSKKRSNIILKCFWIATIVVAIISQLLIASRGGVLAVAVSACALLFSSNIKRKHKLYAICGLLITIYILYSLGYFSLLEYRIANDTSVGSGREFIWRYKFDYYITHSNLLQLIFGMGADAALNIGGKYIGFHNDFLAILCSYGVLGLIVFLYLLILPIFKSVQSQRTIVIVLLLYLAICCLTLEPISAGRLTYISFYFMIYLISSSNSLLEESPR